MGLFGRDTKLDREAVFEQLKIDEGVVNEIYHDHLGYPTFGVGHLVLESDPEYGQEVGTPVSEDRVKECFEKDLDTAISECELLYEEGVFGDLPDEVPDLVNMMFNMGLLDLVIQKCMPNYQRRLENSLIEGRDIGTSKLLIVLNV